MQSLEKENPSKTTGSASQKVLELTVNNHSGVMSHICGLFSRRAFNMEGILCIPIDDGRTSRLWIRVANNGQLDQMVKQLKKLEDVQSVGFHPAEQKAFVKLEEFFRVN